MCVISKPISHEELEYVALVASSLIGVIVADEELHNVGSNRSGTSTIKHKRVKAEEIFEKLGPMYSHRAYIMKESSFRKLHKILFPHNPNLNKRKRSITPNGDIFSIARLSIALCFFAGGG